MKKLCIGGDMHLMMADDVIVGYKPYVTFYYGIRCDVLLSDSDERTKHSAFIQDAIKVHNAILRQELKAKRTPVVKSITFKDGAYRIEREDSKLTAWNNGHRWLDHTIVSDDLLAAMFDRIVELEATLAQIERKM